MARTKVHGEYLDPSVISAQTEVTAVGSDHMLIFDATDNALKKALLSDLIETVGSTPTFTSATISGDLTVDTSTLKVDSSNNRVGIGDSSPNVKLVVSEASGDTALAINDDRSNVSDYTRIDFRHNNITGSQIKSQAIEDFSVSADRTSDLSFHTRNNGTIVDAMYIQEDGNVGIGTTNPSSILHIEGDTNSYSTAPVLYFGSTSTVDAAVRDWAIGPADDSYGNFHIFRGTSTGSDPIGNDGRVFTISSSGNVGIGGTPDSSGRLLVQNGGTNQIVLTNNDSATTNLNMGNFAGAAYISQNYYYDSGHQADDNTKGAFEVFIGDDAYGINYHSAGAMGTRRRDFAITSAGNTGIGTNSPSQFLDVRGHTSIGDGGGAALLNFNSTGNAQLKLNNVEKLRIDNYGQVTLYGNGAGHGYLVPQDQSLGYTNNLNAGAFGILHRGSYDSYVTGNTYYYRTGGSSGWRAKYGAYKSTVMGMVNGAFTFDCSSAAAGSNGDVVSGLASRVRIDSDGLKFGSDTAAANALDDYEEGTYLPTWTTVQANPATYRNADNTSNNSTNGLSYVKIGRQVTISGAAFFSSGNSINNQRPFMTLPFAARVYSVSGVISTYKAGNVEDVHYLNYSASNSINLFKLDSSGSHVGFGSNAAIELYFNITYQTYA